MSNPIQKLKGITAGGTLSLSVSKSGGPVVTRAFVGSTGTDDRSFEDSQLTPGPARMPLQEDNSYSVVWLGAFHRRWQGYVWRSWPTTRMDGGSRPEWSR